MCICTPSIRTPWCPKCPNKHQVETLLCPNNMQEELEKAGYLKFDQNNPPPHGYYLCVGHAKTRYICLMSNGKWYRQSGSKQIVGITHWMEIP